MMLSKQEYSNARNILHKTKYDDCISVLVDKICSSCSDEKCCLDCDVYESENKLYELVDKYCELAEKYEYSYNTFSMLYQDCLSPLLYEDIDIFNAYYYKEKNISFIVLDKDDKNEILKVLSYDINDINKCYIFDLYFKYGKIFRSNWW